MDDAMFRRKGRANSQLARTLAHSVALKIDARYGTFFARLGDEEKVRLLRVRAVALKHFVPVLRVVEIIREKFGQRSAATSLGLRLPSLVSDVALKHASKMLAVNVVHVALRSTSAWTAKGLASLPDAQLQGASRAARRDERTVYLYRGRR